MHEMEYERRWLVTDTSVTDGHLPTMVSQAYLFIVRGWCIRVRRTYQVGPSREESEGQARLAIKGPRTAGGRPEYEWDIDRQLALDLYRLASCSVVKSRYQLIEAGRLWDVDVFHHDNEGLAIAECEESAPGGDISPPDWCGTEITHDHRYNNEELARMPHVLWPSER